MDQGDASSSAHPLPRRIHLLGGPGSGKTTLAQQLARALGIPVYELDEVAFVDFKTTFGLARRRPLAERLATVEEIACQPAWISEGIAVGWTDPLLAAADLVVWLDVPWHLALRRIVHRYLHAVRTDPLPPNTRRWQLRPFMHGLFVATSPVGGSVLRRLPLLRRAVRVLSWWCLYTGRSGWALLDALDTDRIYSRAATAAHLRPYAGKLLRVSSSVTAGELLTIWCSPGAGRPALRRHRDRRLTVLRRAAR
ncbi:MAG TPA: AAA family ATPase [Dehalococcoidia bacterium]